MFLKAIIVGVALTIAILATLIFSVNIASGGSVSVITTLDVCNIKGLVSSSAYDMPVFNEIQCSVCKFCSVVAYDIPIFQFRSILVVFLIERPPSC